MDEDPNGALGPAEDAGDLGGRHLLDEAQDDRAAAVGGQSPDGPPRRGGLVADRGAALDVERVGDVRGGLDRGLSGGAGASARWFATTLRAIRKSQTRNVEAPSPSAGRARSSNRSRFVRAARNVRSVASSAS